MSKDGEKKEESKGIEDGTIKGRINPDPPKAPRGQGGQPPKPIQKMCPLMGPGTHRCRPECSWAWVSPQDNKCVCSVSILTAILRDMAGPLREAFMAKVDLSDPKKEPPSPLIKL